MTNQPTAQGSAMTNPSMTKKPTKSSFERSRFDNDSKNAPEGSKAEERRDKKQKAAFKAAKKK